MTNQSILRDATAPMTDRVARYRAEKAEVMASDPFLADVMFSGETDDEIIAELQAIDADNAAALAAKARRVESLGLKVGQVVRATGHGWHEDCPAGTETIALDGQEWTVVGAFLVGESLAVDLSPVGGGHYAYVWPKQIIG